MHTADDSRGKSRADDPVTRVEIVDHIGHAFSGAAASKADLLLEAERAGGRAQVLDVLRLLPDRRFHRLQDLWTELPDVPIER
jgi:hypothetical protein